MANKLNVTITRYEDQTCVITLSYNECMALLKELTNMTRIDAKISVPILSDIEAKLYYLTNSSRR